MRILRIFGGLLLITATPAFADGTPASWKVSQKSGDVFVFHPGMQAASVQISASLAPGDVVATGPNGRAMLTRGSDYVVVAPGSRLLLPKEQEQSGFTRLVQQVGTMLYKVHHTGLPHFAVQTPMLAAVVKGTSFTVIVDEDRAAIQVTDGIVEVSSAAGQAHRLVERGTTVYVGRERPDSIIELKHGTVDLPSSKGRSVKVAATADMSLSEVTALTGGLVHATAGAPAPATNGTAVTVSAGIAPSVPSNASVTAVVRPAPATVQPATAAVTQPAAAIVQTPGTQPAVQVATAAVPAVAQPVINTVTPAVAAITQPAIGVVQAAVPALTQHTINIVTPTVPTITQPAVNVVQTIVPTVAQPAVSTVAAAVPAITQPVINTVTTVVPAITQPAVNVVQTAVPAVTQPAINTVTAAVPAITQPAVNVVQTVAPPVTQPVINTVTAAVPAVAQPVVSVASGIGGLLGH